MFYIYLVTCNSKQLLCYEEYVTTLLYFLFQNFLVLTNVNFINKC